jgi:hypothetical protein
MKGVASKEQKLRVVFACLWHMILRLFERYCTDHMMQEARDLYKGEKYEESLATNDQMLSLTHFLDTAVKETRLSLWANIWRGETSALWYYCILDIVRIMFVY